MAKQTPPPAKTADVPALRAKFQEARTRMKGSLVERDEEVDIILTALLCQEHPLLVGPPGTAKSLLLDGLMTWMGGADKFNILFNKFTTPEEVFGPISVQGLKEDKYRRVTTGKLPEAECVFVDEIFKASTAILNTMLRILNERVYEAGDGTFKKCPLQICVAASNEWPGEDGGGKELGALFDRFLFRKRVKPVSPKEGRKRLLRAAMENDDCRPTYAEHITAEEIRQAHGAAKVMPWADEAKKGLWEIMQELNKEGIFPGDRRAYKSVTAVRAFAFLCGADKVLPEHLGILAHVLWEDPQEQADKCNKIVMKVANPTGLMINEKLLVMEDVIAKCTPTDAVPKLQAIQKELKGLPESAARDKAVHLVGAGIKELYGKVIGTD